jgi:hypothetical protein
LIFNFISFSWALPFFIFCNKKKEKKRFHLLYLFFIMFQEAFYNIHFFYCLSVSSSLQPFILYITRFQVLFAKILFMLM